MYCLLLHFNLGGSETFSYTLASLVLVLRITNAFFFAKNMFQRDQITSRSFYRPLLKTSTLNKAFVYHQRSVGGNSAMLIMSC